MSCETESSDVKWTRNTSYDGYSYVYINGTITGSHNVLYQFSVVNVSTLRLYNVQPTDSGLYDCYDTDGTRITGYHVVAKGIFSLKKVTTVQKLNYREHSPDTHRQTVTDAQK